MDKKNKKIIHYIWFGGNPLSDLTKKCIETWKKYLPDFEIMEWNEKTFDVNQCAFVKEAYEQKKWAFVADYTRFKVLEKYGGIYLDTDMEITADISKFLEKDLFLGVEDSKMINAAVVWAKEPHNPHIQDIVKIYESKEHFNETGDLYDESVPRVLTKYFEQFGFDGQKDEIQTFDDDKVYVYPMEYFYPLSYDYQNNKFTDNSVMIHHFDATWISPMEKFKTKMKRKNMIWVVYVIDFFISLKNKIKFFSNYRDITIFLVMFLTMLLAMFSIKPVYNNLYITGKSVWQILGFSMVWTYITSKVRSIDLNRYLDDLTNVDPDAEEYKPYKLNLEQTNKFKKRERVLYIVEMLMTIIVAFFPIIQLVNAIPSGIAIFTILSLVNIYFIHLGIKKKFKYRILELIPYAIVLGLMILVNPAMGIITSVATFIFIMIKLKSYKVKPKRIKSFLISYIVAAILFTALSFGISNINNIKEVNVGLNIVSDSNVEEYNQIANQDKSAITEFNAGKQVFFNNIKNTTNNVGILTNTLLAISLCLVAINVAITKKMDYIFLAVIIVANLVHLMSVATASVIYLTCATTCVLVLITAINVLNKALSGK
ncbi:MAG: glycosyltransferase family 32 protein [Clostridia bacterium]